MNITGGKHNGRKILAPEKEICRPTLSKVRMGVFNTLYSLIGSFEDKNFLDMFGGSGIMGIEALSRGFKESFVFEKNPKAVQMIKKNYSAMDLPMNIFVGDSLKLLEKINQKFDVVYIDPPYQSGIYESVFDKLRSYITESTIVIAEHSDEIKIDGYSLIKSKNFGDKIISFYRK